MGLVAIKCQVQNSRARDVLKQSDLSLRVTTAPKGIAGKLWYKRRFFAVSQQLTVGAQCVRFVRHGTA